MITQKDFYKNFQSRSWRLENLYHIVDEKGNKVQFKLRQAQRDFCNNFWFFNIVLKARQLGFTTLIDLIGLDMAIFAPNFRAVIIAETKDKAEDIFYNKIKFPYDNLPDFLKQHVSVVNSTQSELKFSNGSSISVMVSARSGTCQFLHVSEYGPVCAKFPKKAKEILSGSFPAVHEDGFIFVESTAMGQGGYFHEMVKKAEKMQLEKTKLSKLDFKLLFYAWHLNKEYRLEGDFDIPERLLDYFDELYLKHGIELDDEQKNWYYVTESLLGEDMWAEFPSYPDEAFKVAIEGVYYAREFKKIYSENRETLVRHEETLGVYSSWDLGISDDTAIWFFQIIGRELRVIDYYENSGEGLKHYIKILQDKPYRYIKHFAPHDISVREFTSGISRMEKAKEYGLEFTRVPTNVDLFGGIEAVRDVLNYCYFDKSKCEKGLQALSKYKKAWNERLGCYSNKPLHDECSHGADAFRTFAVAKAFNLIDELKPKAFDGNVIRKKGGLTKR